MFTTTLDASDPFVRSVAVVHVSLADFLYMYSGEASAAEIAGMCMSGRVSVPWSSYSKLKAFAECFDFSTEKWEAYYASLEAARTPRGSKKPVNSIPQCSKSCCQSSTKEEIDANWQMVSDTTTTSVRAAAGTMTVTTTTTTTTAAASATSCTGEWEVVSDCKCYTLPKENREEMEQVFGTQQIDDWLSKLWSGHIKRSNEVIQTNVKKSFHDLKEMTGKLFVSLEA